VNDDIDELGLRYQHTCENGHLEGVTKKNKSDLDSYHKFSTKNGKTENGDCDIQDAKWKKDEEYGYFAIVAERYLPDFARSSHLCLCVCGSRGTLEDNQLEKAVRHEAVEHSCAIPTHLHRVCERDINVIVFGLGSVQLDTYAEPITTAVQRSSSIDEQGTRWTLGYSQWNNIPRLLASHYWVLSIRQWKVTHVEWIVATILLNFGICTGKVWWSSLKRGWVYYTLSREI